jgi:hypothetical protein
MGHVTRVRIRSLAGVVMGSSVEGAWRQRPRRDLARRSLARETAERGGQEVSPRRERDGLIAVRRGAARPGRPGAAACRAARRAGARTRPRRRPRASTGAVAGSGPWRTRRGTTTATARTEGTERGHAPRHSRSRAEVPPRTRSSRRGREDRDRDAPATTARNGRRSARRAAVLLGSRSLISNLLLTARPALEPRAALPMGWHLTGAGARARQHGAGRGRLRRDLTRGMSPPNRGAWRAEIAASVNAHATARPRGWRVISPRRARSGAPGRSPCRVRATRRPSSGPRYPRVFRDPGVPSSSG